MPDEVRDKINREFYKVIPKSESKSLGSVMYRPKRITFATQNKEERVFVLIRAHWIKNLQWVINNFVYSILPLGLLFVGNLLNVSLEFLSFKVYLAIILAYYSIIFTNVIRSFYDWYYDTFIVTNERIVDYEFNPFRGYKVKEAGLESIEDVEERASGLISTIFNYGDLITRTSSTVGELTFNSIADPTRVRDILMDLSKIVKTYRRDTD